MSIGNFKITEKMISKFREHLVLEEKSPVTVEKYCRDVEKFRRFLGEELCTREQVIGYKQWLVEQNRVATGINSGLASLNSFFKFLGREDFKVKQLKVQKSLCYPEEKELTKAEYLRLLETAEKTGKKQVGLILQTICGTGIRISELAFITVERVQKGSAAVRCKGKTREIFFIRKLQKKLMHYIKEKGIVSGPVFVTKKGNPIHRTTVWRWMKALCQEARVNPSKVFPHNLRHLFARTFFQMEKDMVKLADILGHSSLNTTRIYTMTTLKEHHKKMERLGLVV